MLKNLNRRPELETRRFGPSPSERAPVDESVVCLLMASYLVTWHDMLCQSQVPRQKPLPGKTRVVRRHIPESITSRRQHWKPKRV